MSLRLDLKTACLEAMYWHIQPHAMTDEDFAFLDMVGQYGDRRATQIVENEQKNQERRPFKNFDGPEVREIDPAEPKPAKTLDRGPEPQTLADTLSTEAPKPADPEGDGDNAPGAPDYETLITKEPEGSTDDQR